VADATPLQSPSDTATDYQVLQFLILQRLLKIQTATVVKVLAVTPAALGALGPLGTVDVLPLVDQVDGAGNAIPHVTLYGRPYVRLQGGANAIVIDPQVGDLGLMVFCARDISSVIVAKQSGPPASARAFSYADGIYVGGMLNGVPTSYLQWLDDGTLNIVSPVAVNITAPEINVTGPVNITGTVNANGAIIDHTGEVTDALGKVLGTHIHSGVQTGGSDTGPPV